MDLILRFSADEAGAPAVEYALLLAFIAVAILASVRSFGAAVANLYTIPWP
jgi:Flp pilus assembly pilin Flp